ncbi:MAG TPA: aminoacyl-tRNA hydrolase [Candidatus Limnocylindrales bacterium]
MTSVWLVVGLGNPGPKYAANRHNAGFMVVDLLAKRMGARFARHKRTTADVAEAKLGVGLDAPTIVLVKPLTYMNLSGGPVTALSRFYKVPPEQIIIVHDELDIPFGQLRLKIGGGEGGHNGVRSISPALSTKDYVRVRFGIGRPPGRQDPADFVLNDFSSVERKELDFLVDRAADAVETVVTKGLGVAQNIYHTA